jgi:hypothetical protein
VENSKGEHNPMTCAIWENFYEAKCSEAAYFSEEAIFEHVLKCPDCKAYREKSKKKIVIENCETKGQDKP